MKRRSVLGFLALALAGCGSTGGELLEFDAYAAGPEGRTAGEPYTFVTDRGYEVTLTTATLHIGAVYLNQSVPTSVSSDTSCYLAGQYVAEVTGGVDVDLLDPTRQPFSARGFGTTERAKTAELWLSGGDIDADVDPTVIASVEGVATRGADSFPFSASVTIGQNRALEASDPAQPGARPICKQRVVSPIEVDLRLEEGGALVVRIDPAGWFDNVSFDELELVEDDPPRYRFRDDSLDQPSRNLFNGLRANAGVYELDWVQ